MKSAQGTVAEASSLSDSLVSKRLLPVGAEVLGDSVHFRVWAPDSKSVHLLLSSFADLSSPLEGVKLQPEKEGYFSGSSATAKAGMHYKFRLDRGAFPDPVSRFQPEGPLGASRIVDPRVFKWSDRAWQGVKREGQVIYEMHVGSFTQTGTWRSAIEELPELARIGITIIELMPVADFQGKFGWGYDGVNLFAPTHLYGGPDDMRAFVDSAHGLGLGVILDVVYNHLGPDGNFLPEFSEDYLSREHVSEWGNGLNFDGPNCAPVREFFIANARYWIEEFHIDGLRLDATQQILDSSPDHIIAALTRAVRSAGKGRGTYIVGENEPQHTKLVRPPKAGGYGIDSLWNDDFHHSAIVALTGKNEAYYTDYQGSAQEFVSAAKWGYLYQGQRYKWQKARRGTPSLDLHPSNFVTFIENHDQVANSLWGQRVHTVAKGGSLRAMTALLLLGPGTPMLFQGQEFAASTPFLYFADHNPQLAQAVAKGRAEFLRQFPSINSPEAAAFLPDPGSEETFLRCKLDFVDRKRNSGIYDLHSDLIAIRKSDPLIGKVQPGTFDGAVLNDSAFLLRFFGRSQDDRLLIVNLGAALQFDPAPEPLLAPPEGLLWDLRWSSEDPRYGGSGTPPVDSEDNWRIPANSAVLMVPKPTPTGNE